MEKSTTKFMQPKCVDGFIRPTHCLYVANCGPAVGLLPETVASAFGTFGSVKAVHIADDSGTRVVVEFNDVTSAQSAKEALDGLPCRQLDGRVLHICYSVAREECQVVTAAPVFTTASEMDLPGIHLIPEFVSPYEEMELLAAVDQRPWQGLLKRRVQHYGYEFIYKIRNVDRSKYLGPLPTFLLPLVVKITSLPEMKLAEDSLPLDQLTVNEYPPGVGLSPHIDTHSAFQGCIISLSLAGTCIMEFRRYMTNACPSQGAENDSIPVERNCNNTFSSKLDDHLCCKTMPYYERKVIFLPPRSLLIMSGEARYVWHHYIPHHKVDIVNGVEIHRNSRRVSLTFRKVRKGSCDCDYPQCCDSQMLSVHS